MNCRLGCGACCIAPSISTPIPGMPDGKPTGTRCVQLDDDNLCKLFGQTGRPSVCHAFKADPAVCGSTNEQALSNLIQLESLTR